MCAKSIYYYKSVLCRHKKKIYFIGMFGFYMRHRHRYNTSKKFFSPGKYLNVFFVYVTVFFFYVGTFCHFFNKLFIRFLPNRDATIVLVIGNRKIYNGLYFLAQNYNIYYNMETVERRIIIFL